ncbi:MAG: class I SAM-dependent methyltransferase [Phycisphaerales bacterium]|nr:MAG: class I SAM-dependent methyltransferase [Phycisphaerales bacterium]
MTKQRIPPFTVHFHLPDGAEILNTSDGEWSDRTVNYDADCLTVWNKNTEFLRDPRFVAAYESGMSSGHKLGRAAGSDVGVDIQWRVHVACWAGWHARQLEGDFVECGVNTGIFSLAICNYIDLNATGKTFYLFDTFCGIPSEQIAPEERALGREEESAEFYEECYELAKRNFARFPRAKLIRGRVPDSLNEVTIEKVCYLSIDMNIAAPELAALEHFWDGLVPGAIVLLDDYGWLAYANQKRALDSFAARRGVEILTLPTGQGLLLKP